MNGNDQEISNLSTINFLNKQDEVWKENMGKGYEVFKVYKDGKMTIEMVSPENKDTFLKDIQAGGGKVKSKFFTGGKVHASFGTDFDDR